MKIEPHEFTRADFVGGHLVIDLLNTVTARDTGPVDWLGSPAALRDWVRACGSFDRATSGALARQLAVPREGERMLRRVKAVRESIYRLVHALVTGVGPARREAAAFEREARRALQRAHLVQEDKRVHFAAPPAETNPEFLPETLVLRALTLLDELPPGRTRICAGHDCGWIFLDTSKAGRRRWCDMAVCGNTAKSRRFLQRQRKKGGASQRSYY